MSDETLERRVTDLEISVGIVRHDVNNMRMAVTGLESKLDKLGLDLRADVMSLRGTVSRIGLTIVGAIFMLLIGIIGYFVQQKDAQMQQIMQSRTTAERSVDNAEGIKQLQATLDTMRHSGTKAKPDTTTN